MTRPALGSPCFGLPQQQSHWCIEVSAPSRPSRSRETDTGRSPRALLSRLAGLLLSACSGLLRVLLRLPRAREAATRWEGRPGGPGRLRNRWRGKRIQRPPLMSRISSLTSSSSSDTNRARSFSVGQTARRRSSSTVAHRHCVGYKYCIVASSLFPFFVPSPFQSVIFPFRHRTSFATPQVARHGYPAPLALPRRSLRGRAGRGQPCSVRFDAGDAQRSKPQGARSQPEIQLQLADCVSQLRSMRAQIALNPHAARPVTRLSGANLTTNDLETLTDMSR